MAKTAQDFVSEAKQQIKEVDANQANNLIEQGATVLDVRELHEYEQGHIAKAIHIPRGLLEFAIAQHPQFEDKSQILLVYCLSGGRSALAASVLKQMGYSAVYSLQGGYQHWQSAHQ